MASWEVRLVAAAMGVAFVVCSVVAYWCYDGTGDVE